jgi:hypothetical protein
MVYNATVTPDFNAIINGAVHAFPSGPNSSTNQPTVMNATFTPNFGLSLDQAAKLGGFIGFNWQQSITAWPSPSTLYPFGTNINPNNPTGLTAPPKFLDPVPGGYTSTGHDISYPFFYTANVDLPKTNNTLFFSDQPFEPCLFGGSGAGCGGKVAPLGSVMAFETDLVGVLPGGLGVPLYEFDWISTYTGTPGIGTVAQSKSIIDDPGGGVGGVTLLSASVPEPSTWAMMLLGFAGLGFAFRRSRRKAAFA